MKDLKDELAQRLQKVRDERKQLTDRLNRLVQLEQAIDLLINEEDFSTGTGQLSPLPVKAIIGPNVIGRTELSRLIVKALADGKPRSLTDLVQLAKNENFNFFDKSPKRVLHFALVGLQYNGYARMLERSIWQLTEKAIAEHKVINTAS